MLYLGVALLFFVFREIKINTFAAEKITLDVTGIATGAEVHSSNSNLVTIDVTGLVTGSDIGHDCQKYLADEYD